MNSPARSNTKLLVFKFVLIGLLIIAVSPLIVLGLLLRLMKVAMAAGGQIADDACDWLDKG